MLSEYRTPLAGLRRRSLLGKVSRLPIMLLAEIGSTISFHPEDAYYIPATTELLGGDDTSREKYSTCLYRHHSTRDPISNHSDWSTLSQGGPLLDQEMRT